VFMDELSSLASWAIVVVGGDVSMVWSKSSLVLSRGNNRISQVKLTVRVVTACLANRLAFHLLL
jgi:hypothetical protein